MAQLHMVQVSRLLYFVRSPDSNNKYPGISKLFLYIYLEMFTLPYSIFVFFKTQQQALSSANQNRSGTSLPSVTFNYLTITFLAPIFQFWRSMSDMILVRGHPLSTYAKFSEKLTFLIRTCAYQGVRNFSFSENSAYVLNGWALI